MYRITCDGYSLLDTRDEKLIVKNAKAKLEDNTVGEASFTIYKAHPNYDRLAMMRSVFEILDEYGVIFRGRMTENSRDIKKGKAVDLEGAMAFFNDSIVRPYKFPDDFLEDEGYIAAKASGNVVAFYLGWLIEQHNAQVADFQQLKLGTVTVEDANNFIERANSEYPNTFEEIKSKLFNSTLGGHICIRYEADGNYIDYLAEFTETNEQGIVYGENLRDLSETEDGKEVYSAIIPRGGETKSTTEGGDVYEGMYGDITSGSTVTMRLTIAELPDGDVTDDIVKQGDMLYSKSAVAAYGWRYVPSGEAIWDDVTLAQNLQKRGVDVLEGSVTKIPKTIECKAVDLHCTDAQIRSFRLYKKIPVYIATHGINEDFDITTLEIDLLNPQNTVIAAGKTIIAMTDLQAKQTDEVKSLVTKQTSEGFKTTTSMIEKTAESIKLEIASTYATKGELENVGSSIVITEEQIRAAVGLTAGELAEIKISAENSAAAIALVVTDGKVNGSLLIDAINGESKAKISADRLELDGKTLNISVDATNITGKLTADQIDAKNLEVAATNITGTLVVGNLPDGVAMDDDIPTDAEITTITKNTITAEYIKGLKLEVGEHISMGADAKISWDNVDKQPTIPTDTNQLTNSAGFTTMSAVQNQGYQNANQVTEITKNTITTAYINALKITAAEAAIADKVTVGSIFSADDTTGVVTIGGWNVDNNSLYTAEKTIGTNGYACICSEGTEAFANIAGSGNKNGWVFTAGSSFGVDTEGNLYANSGKIGGWTLDDTSLIAGELNGVVPKDGFFLMSTEGVSSPIVTGGHSDTNWCLVIGSTFGVTKQGQLCCAGGEIGGWNIDYYAIESYDGSQYYAGMSSYYQKKYKSLIGEESNLRFYAGAKNQYGSFESEDEAPQFYVLEDGSLYANAAKIKGHIEATSGSFTGTVTSASGKIGNWHIFSDYLSSQNWAQDDVAHPYPKNSVVLSNSGVKYWSPTHGAIFASWEDIAYKCRSTT